MKRKIVDPDLGELVYSHYDIVKNFAGVINFQNNKGPVDVFFDTSSYETPPTSSQKSFLRNIIDNYNKFIETIYNVLPKELREEYGNLDKMKADLIVISLTVPNLNEGFKNWDMTFQIKSQNHKCLIVYFENMIPLSAYIEYEKTNWIIRIYKFLLRL